MDGINQLCTFLCCGAHTCIACNRSKQIKECPFCRSKFFKIETDADVLRTTVRLANMGNPIYQFNLGVAYIHEYYGLKKNLEKAVYWFRRAADQGFRDAQFELAVCYREGEHVPKSLVTARKLFEQAAFRNHTRAQTQLARFYLQAQGGLNRDLDKAVYWFTIVASSTDGSIESSLDATFQCAFARYSLGRIYKNEPSFMGKDCSRELAKYWFQRAIHCEFRGQVLPVDKEHHLVGSCKWVKGISQHALALTLLDLWNENYASTDIPGPVPYPTMLRLLQKAHNNNANQGSLEIAEITRNMAKNFCANCGKVASNNRTLKRCSVCKAVYYCDRTCQANHYKMHHRTVCNAENDNN